MLAEFPLATARDRRWWSHWSGAPWGRQTHQQVFSKNHSKKGQWTCHTLLTSGLNCHWLKVVIALEVMIFLTFCGCKTSLSGGVFIVALRKNVDDCCIPHQAPAFVPGAQSQVFRPPFIVSQADRLQRRGETNAGQ